MNGIRILVRCWQFSRRPSGTSWCLTSRTRPPSTAPHSWKQPWAQGPSMWTRSGIARTLHVNQIRYCQDPPCEPDQVLPGDQFFFYNFVFYTLVFYNSKFISSLFFQFTFYTFVFIPFTFYKFVFYNSKFIIYKKIA